jgi:putative tryptophan/tyrosine transport system substrate-binding protein
MIRRREFIAGLGGAAAWPFAGPLAAEAQRRVGALLDAPENDPRSQSIVVAFQEGLATFGWVEGRNLRIDFRFAGRDLTRLPAYAEELASLRPDVIFAMSGPVARAVQQHTQVIPIVFVGGGDPSSSGMVRNIARPESNMTGFANIFGSLGGRWLEVFKEAVPRLTRVADIFFANEISVRNEPRATIPVAATQLGITIIRTPVRNAVEVEHAISAFATEPDGGLLVTAGNLAVVEVIGRLALHHHLPMVYGAVADTRPEGILIAHGPDLLDGPRCASSYVDRILRGAKPSELPVQYPTKFELVVNLKTAKAIGVTTPKASLPVPTR